MSDQLILTLLSLKSVANFSQLPRSTASTKQRVSLEIWEEFLVNNPSQLLNNFSLLFVHLYVVGCKPASDSEAAAHFLSVPPRRAGCSSALHRSAPRFAFPGKATALRRRQGSRSSPWPGSPHSH